MAAETSRRGRNRRSSSVWKALDWLARRLASVGQYIGEFGIIPAAGLGLRFRQFRKGDNMRRMILGSVVALGLFSSTLARAALAPLDEVYEAMMISQGHD